MGTGSFTDQNDGEVADAVDVQQIIDALKQDLVPRNASGVATTEAGDLGTSTFKFKKAEIVTGYFSPGMIMPMHTYNGTVSVGQGWYPCDGTIINETNYNTFHGAGSWDTYIGSSDLDGKYTPNLTGRYLTGAASTTQTGASAITAVGNASNENTGGGDHQHDYNFDVGYTLTGDPGSSSNKTFRNTGGTFTEVGSAIETSGSQTGFLVGSADASSLTDVLGIFDGIIQSRAQVNTSTTFNTFNLNVRPDSIEVVYYIRII